MSQSGNLSGESSLPINEFILFVNFAILPFNGVIALKRLFLLALIVAAVRLLWEKRSWPSVPLPLALWFSLAPISLIWSANPSYTSGELLPDVLYPLLGLVATSLLCESRRCTASAVGGLLTGGCAVIATGLFQAYQAPAYDWHQLAHGYGQFSTYLILLLPFVLISASNSLLKQRWGVASLHIVILAGVLVAGYSANNRMFWLSTLLVLTLLTGLLIARKEYALSRRCLGLFAAIIAPAIIAVFVYQSGRRSANAIDQLAETSLTSTFTNSERFEMWRFWVERILDHPWFGIGFGYDLPMMTYQSLKPDHWPSLMFAHAHNVFLNVTVQLGLIGLTVFCIAQAWLIRIFWKAYKSEDINLSLAGLTGCGVVIGMLSKNFTDDFFWRGTLFAFWLLVGLLLGRMKHSEQVN